MATRNLFKIFIMIGFIFSGFVILSCGAGKPNLSSQADGVYASMKLNKQELLIKLFYKEAPIAVSSFIGLASGKFEGNTEREGNFFDGLTFHRVVEDFVVQGGDPKGDGTGGPGYSFPDETDNGIGHSKKGMLSMANSGPDTNGSQFFITLKEQPHLDGKHTVFGEVVSGEDLLTSIVQNDTIDSIKIYAKGEEAEAFVDNISWDNFQDLIKNYQETRLAKLAEQKDIILGDLRANTELTETSDGVFFRVIQKGSGRKARINDTVDTHYELKLYGVDQIIDSSYERNQVFTLQVGNGNVIKGWDLILEGLQKGEKIQAIIPPELAYGSRGAGGVIPPEAFLDFTIEIIDIK